MIKIHPNQNRLSQVVGVVCIGSQEECPDKFWKCKDTYECVPMAFVCDGPEDCTDGSEESEELCNVSTPSLTFFSMINEVFFLCRLLLRYV